MIVIGIMNRVYLEVLILLEVQVNLIHVFLYNMEIIIKSKW